MITLDTIITAELLSGLDKCPFCGAGTLHSTRTEETLECGTYLRLGSRAEKNRGLGCYEHENETIRARVKELEWAGDKMAKYLIHGPYDKNPANQLSERLLRVSMWERAKGTK